MVKVRIHNEKIPANISNEQTPWIVGNKFTNLIQVWIHFVPIWLQQIETDLNQSCKFISAIELVPLKNPFKKSLSWNVMSHSLPFSAQYQLSILCKSLVLCIIGCFMLPICSKIKRKKSESERRLFCIRMKKIIFALHKKANDFFMIHKKEKERKTKSRATVKPEWNKHWA